MNMSKAALFAACAGIAMLAGCAPKAASEDWSAGRICAFGATPRFRGTTGLGPPSPEAVKIVRRIAQGVGIHANFRIMSANVERGATAFATIRNNRRYIVYDRSEFSWGKGNANWHDVYVMGHEVGHHIASHVYANEISGHEQELEADRFAGFALARLGASLKQATSWFSDWPATISHPGGARRRKAVIDGWMEGHRMMRLEAEPCASGWSGSEIDVDGSICRIARICSDGEPKTRLACQDYDGSWRWTSAN